MRHKPCDTAVPAADMSSADAGGQLQLAGVATAPCCNSTRAGEKLFSWCLGHHLAQMTLWRHSAHHCSTSAQSSGVSYTVRHVMPTAASIHCWSRSATATVPVFDTAARLLSCACYSTQHCLRCCGVKHTRLLCARLLWLLQYAEGAANADCTAPVGPCSGHIRACDTACVTRACAHGLCAHGLCNQGRNTPPRLGVRC